MYISLLSAKHPTILALLSPMIKQGHSYCINKFVSFRLSHCVGHRKQSKNQITERLESDAYLATAETVTAIKQSPVGGADGGS